MSHNPVIDWDTGEIVKWSTSCITNCIPQPIRVCTVSSCILLPQYAEFSDVFCKNKAEILPPHRSYDCAIDLVPGAQLPKGRLYSLSAPENQAMEEYIRKSLDKGFIRPSKSPLSSGFFFVKITIKNTYPLPLISVLFDQIQSAKVFSKIDLRGAYNPIRIREGDEWKTAFSTQSGHFEYLVMPFGLSNAPAVFQDFINDILRPFLGRFIVVYLDDILIFSPSLALHREHVRTVLQSLRENKLFAKAEKCVFEVEKISFLGYIISSYGFSMDPKKLQAVLDWPVPNSLKATQRFLGFTNYYRRFIASFSLIVAPIVALTKKGADPSRWSPQAIQAFEALKRAFSSAPILRHPDPELPFEVEVDASEVGVGAVLSQRDRHSFKLHPCAFLSRKFLDAERNYDVGNRELLAIKLAFEEWRHWLEGAKHQIAVFTDHKNLQYIESAKRLNPRQGGWALFFTRFDFVISYRPGSKNQKADALSRSFLPVQEIKPAAEPILPSSSILLAVS